jgi:hypothetical protein
VERSTLDAAWVKLGAVEEEKRQAKEAGHQHRTEVRKDAQVIRAGAAQEVEERLAQVK